MLIQYLGLLGRTKHKPKINICYWLFSLQVRIVVRSLCRRQSGVADPMVQLGPQVQGPNIRFGNSVAISGANHNATSNNNWIAIKGVTPR